MAESVRSWTHRLLCLCGDVESNPGPPTPDGQRAADGGERGPGLPPSWSRVSLASIRSTIRRRRKELYIEPTPLWGSCRLLLAAMGFLGFVNVYATRVNLSVALVCMINHTAINAAATTAIAAANDTDHSINGTFTKLTTPEATLSYSDAGVLTTTSANGSGVLGDGLGGTGGRCLSGQGSSPSSASEDGEFSWPKETQGLILGSFFWGYMTTQILGGLLSTRFGGKRVYGWFMFLCSVSTLLMPLAARTDYRFLLALRFLAGVGQGVTFPAMNELWANWAPPLESSKLGSISYSGSQVGNVVTFPLAGLLCQYGFDGGWPSIFYILGILGLLWFVAWNLLVFDSPSEHPRIRPDERDYITTSLQGKMAANRQGSSHVPVWTLVTSRPVWGIVITHTCSNFGTYTFLTNIPTYLKEVLHFDIKQNGFLSALPYIFFWLAIVVSGQLADIVRSRGILTTTQTRKVGNSIGMLMPGTFVAAVGYMTCQQSTTAVALLTVGVAMSGFQYGSGWMVNPVDIAPRYAGVIFGLSNTFATIPGFVAPIAIGVITANQTQAEWQTVFFIATGIYTVGALAYILLGSGDLQPWAQQQEDAQPRDKADQPPGESLLEDEPPPARGPPSKSLVSFRLLEQGTSRTDQSDSLLDNGEVTETVDGEGDYGQGDADRAVVDNKEKSAGTEKSGQQNKDSAVQFY